MNQLNYTYNHSQNTLKSGKGNLRILDTYKLNENIKFKQAKKRKINRYLSSNNNYEFVKINEFDINIRIHIPIHYLKNEYNKNITSYGLILYNSYPLISPNNTNFSEKIISLRMFDKDFNKIEISNLNIPIDIFIKKPYKEFNNCVFFDPHSNFWGVEGCKSIDLGHTMLCSCTHLTDFSLSKYNPTLILRDMFNIVSDAWIINDFKTFENLKFENAQVIFIYISITCVYIFGLIFTLKYDRKEPNDNYIYEVNRINYCCSKKEILENINEIKEITNKAEEERKIRTLKYLESKLQVLNLNQKILKTFGINIQLEKDQNIEIPDEDNNYLEDLNIKNRRKKTFREVFTSKYIKNDVNTNIDNLSKEEDKINKQENENIKCPVENCSLSDKKQSIMIREIEMQNIKTPGSSMLDQVDEGDGKYEDENFNEENYENIEFDKDDEFEDKEETKNELKINSLKKKTFMFNFDKEKDFNDNNGNNPIEEIYQNNAKINSSPKKSNFFDKSSKIRSSKKISFDNQEELSVNNQVKENNGIKEKLLRNESLNSNEKISIDEKLITSQNENLSKNFEIQEKNLFESKVENKVKEPKKILDVLNKSSFSKILVEGLKIKLQNKLVNHDEFIFRIYNQNENEEIKKDILKYFVIKESNSKKNKYIKKFKNKINKKLKEKNHHNNKNESRSEFENSNDLGKTIINSTTEKIDFKSLNDKQLNNCLCEKTDDNIGDLNLTTKDDANLQNNSIAKDENPIEMDIEKDEEFSISKIELRYRLLFKYFNLLKFFFVNEYRLICLFMTQFNSSTKTTFLSVLIFKIYCSLSVCAILSPTMENEEKSTKVNLNQLK